MIPANAVCISSPTFMKSDSDILSISVYSGNSSAAASFLSDTFMSMPFPAMSLNSTVSPLSVLIVPSTVISVSPSLAESLIFPSFLLWVKVISSALNDSEIRSSVNPLPSTVEALYVTEYSSSEEETVLSNFVSSDASLSLKEAVIFPSFGFLPKMIVPPPFSSSRSILTTYLPLTKIFNVKSELKTSKLSSPIAAKEEDSKSFLKKFSVSAAFIV